MTVALSPSARADSNAVAQASLSLGFADRSSVPGEKVFTPEDHAFLDEFEQRGIQYFLDEADPVTGLMPDRAHADGGLENDVASIASVGFGLTCLVIGEERGWVPRQQVYDRALKVVTFLRDKAPQERGHFYHFLNMRTGKRMWNCEVSNIDTAILMAGVLTVRQRFPNTDLAAACTQIYERVDWPWLMNKDGTLQMGWKPESGFIDARWDHYSEGAPLIVLLGMGSKTHPLVPEVWKAWPRRPVQTHYGLTFLQCPPLFTHQYPQCWFDLRGMRDDFANYYRNSQLATIAQRHWMIEEMSRQFPQYNSAYWGLTASDFKEGYTAWGGPPADGPIDGSVVPAAAAGSLAFEPKLCIEVLRSLKERFGEKGWKKYGFVDAMNPKDNWYNRDVIGIDVGPSVIMAENARTGFIWKTFMATEEAQRAMRAAGFREITSEEVPLTETTSLYEAKP